MLAAAGRHQRAYDSLSELIELYSEGPATLLRAGLCIIQAVETRKDLVCVSPGLFVPPKETPKWVLITFPMAILAQAP